MAGKDLRVGANLGGGPPLGYKWSIHYLIAARKEALEFLSLDQYEHLVQQLKQLAGEDDPSHSLTQSVDAIEDFFELRDKGGILGNINVRVFFYLDAPKSVLLVLGAINKKNDGSTSQAVKIRYRRRLRSYLNGEYEGP